MSVRELLASIEVYDADGKVVRARNSIHWAFELRIGGLFARYTIQGEKRVPVAAGEERRMRFYSGPAPAPLDSPGFPSASYTDVPAIVDTTAYQAKFDGLQGWVSAGATKIDLRPSRLHDLVELCKTADGPAYRAGLATEIAMDVEPPFDIEFIDAEVTDWPAAGTLCVGLEVMRYEIDGGVMTVIEREAFGSPRQRHRVDPLRNTFPSCTDAIVSWEGRPAELSVTVVHLGARALDSIELVAGFIDGPIDSGDPSLVRVAVTPWISAIERVVGSRDAITGLQWGWKVWDADDLRRTIAVRQRYPRGAYRDEATAFNPANRILVDSDKAQHEGIFDILADDQRRGVVELRDGEKHEVESYDGDELVLGVGNIGRIEGADWTLISSAPAEILREVDLAPAGSQAVRWPHAAVDAINRGLRPGSHLDASAAAGHEASFIDVRLELWNEEAQGAALLCIANSPANVAPDLILQPYDPGRAWYGVDFADPESDQFPLDADQVRPAQRARTIPPERELPITANRGDLRAGRNVVPIRGVANAFWDKDRWIHVENDRPFPAPPFNARVEWSERGVDRATTPRIIAVTAAATIFPGVPGYLLEVDPDDRRFRFPFGDWNGERTVKVRATVNARDVGPGELLLQLLTSRIGDGTNGVDDVLPFGAGIPSDRINRPSFLGFPTDALVADIEDIDLTQEQKLGALVGPLLRAMRAQLVEHLDLNTGRRRLYLDASDAALSTEAVAVRILDGRWMRRRRPATDVDRRVINRIDFEANFGADNKPAVALSVVDDALVNEVGGYERQRTDASGRSMKEQLRGVRLRAGSPTSQEAVLRPVAEGRFARFGRPRRLARGTLSAGDMLRTGPGQVVLVDSSTTRAADGTLGIEGEAGQIVAWKLDPFRMTCEVDIAIGFQLVKGYAPNLLVVGIVDDDTVTVARNYCAETPNRAGDEVRDVDFWRVGQPIRLIRYGVTPRKIAAVITAIDRDLDRVSFSIDHGFDASRLGLVDLPAYFDCPPIDRDRWAWIGPLAGARHVFA